MPSYGSNDGYGQQRLSSRPSTRQSAIGAQQRDSSQMANLLAETDIQRVPAGQTPDASRTPNSMRSQPPLGHMQQQQQRQQQQQQHRQQVPPARPRQQAEHPTEMMSYQRQQPPPRDESYPRQQPPPPRNNDALRQLERARAELAEAERNAAALQQQVLLGRGMQQQQQQQQPGPYQYLSAQPQQQMQQMQTQQRPPPSLVSMPQPSRGSNFDDVLDYEAVRSAARYDEARSQEDMSPAREYELAKYHAAESHQRQQLERQRQLEAATAHMSPAERKEAKIVDWIRGGNPWADQGFVPMSETQGNREYVSSQPRGLGSSGIAAARLQRSEGRVSSHRALR